jgi:DnaA family protein
MTRQFPLNLSLNDSASLESFLPGRNLQAVTDISRSLAGEGEPFLFLWGVKYAGKTHLLQAACRQMDELSRTAAYIPLGQASQLSPELLANLDGMDLVCLDDMQEIAGKPDWEEGLFHLFNRIRSGDAILLVTADCSPATLPLKLPDLVSRLASGVSYRLHALDDREKQTALEEAAHRRGMDLTSETTGYILKHCARDMGSLLAFIERLDRASLAAQRKLTIPFVRTLLQQPTDQT